MTKTKKEILLANNGRERGGYVTVRNLDNGTLNI